MNRVKRLPHRSTRQAHEVEHVVSNPHPGRSTNSIGPPH